MASAVDTLLDRFADVADETALIGPDGAFTYGELRRAVEDWRRKLADAGIGAGHVVMLKGDFSLPGVAALLSLFRSKSIAAPLAPTSFEKASEFETVGAVQWRIDVAGNTIERTAREGVHALYDDLRRRGAAGLVLFSSGSTGVSKGVVHDVDRLLSKFESPGKSLRTLAFLLFDHIAGIDTLFYSLANTSALVLPSTRSPDEICRLIEVHRVQVLPTAPSFLNLLLLSGAHESYDLSSLDIITYGSEMMPQGTLERCAAAFPSVRLIQKYGTSEMGAPATRSRDDRSTWMKLGGDGVAWRVRDGKFEIKSKTAMLGYLNAPSPFTDDGYFMTGDRVEVDGDYVRFLGRDSDIINVGGQKVFPAEVENLIGELDEVAEVAVFGEPHAIMGAAVVARIRPADPEAAPAALRRAVRAHLAGKVEPYKIPQKFKFTDAPIASDRFKTVRRDAP